MGLLLAHAAFSAPLYAAPFKVVIDPGHGGFDLGTVFEKGAVRVAEKDITLLLAKGVAQKLKARGYQAYLTRDGDKALALPARTAIANRLKADVFLSIHMNSVSGPGLLDGSEGIETYILNTTTDDSSKRLAHFENSVLTSPAQSGKGAKAGKGAAAASEGAVGEELQGDDLDVALILKDLRLDANLSESKRLACSIQGALAGGTYQSVNLKRYRLRDRGVRQALFFVLLGADMPSVLVEAGFLSSARDRAVVLTPSGRDAISSAIVRGIEQFRKARGTRAGQLALSRCKVH